MEEGLNCLLNNLFPILNWKKKVTKIQYGKILDKYY